MLRISPTPEDPVPGKVMAHNPCLCGGTLEIFLAPQRPAPLVAVIGDSPIAHALISVGAALGYDMVPAHDIPDDATAVVVASHGRDEVTPLTAALQRGVAYVGLVASPKRGAAVIDGLVVDDAMKALVVTPAGLDIGARTPEEVALSILADIIARRPRPSARPVGDDSAPATTADRPGVRDGSGRGRRRAAPRSRRTAPLVLRHRVPACLRRRPGALHRRVMEDPDARVENVAAVRQALDDVDYIADLGLATAVFCAVRLPQPLLLEGEAGVGKTEAGKAIAEVLDTPLRTAAVLRGHHRRRGAVRVELPPPAAGHPDGRSRRRGSSRSRTCSRSTSSSADRCCGPSSTPDLGRPSC